VSQPETHKVKLSDFRERKRAQGTVEIEADDGTVFKVDPPELWPDEVNFARNNVAAAKIILGDQYEAFIAAGGTALLLVGIVGEVHGVTLGESLASAGS
jgi:hypothetical protein